MKFLFKKFIYVFFLSLICGCGISMRISEIPISDIPKDELQKQLDNFTMDEEQLEELIRDKKLTTEQKIKKIAKDGTIRDIVLLLWVINRSGKKLPEVVNCLHSADQIFKAKAAGKKTSSFECMEASMLAAAILKEKNIDAYLLHMNGTNLLAGHTVCVYRTKQGWATIGVSSYDSTYPSFLRETFDRSINKIFRYATRGRWFTRNIITYSIRRPEEINSQFINKGPTNLFWLNLSTFFRGRWF